MEILKLYSQKVLEENTPLILVFGREMNGDFDAQVVKDVGFCKDESNCNSMFWSRAQSLVARQVGKDSLNKEFNDKDSSPICFTNLLPIAIPNEVANKGKIRSKVSKEKVRQGVDNVFDVLASYKLIDRVQMCLVSYQKHHQNQMSPFVDQEGKQAFDAAVDQLHQHFYAGHIEYVPYLLARGGDGFLDGSLSSEGKDHIKAIAKDWLSANGLN